MPDLLVIVPSRGRPGAVRRVAQAWHRTGAAADAVLMFAVDADDPKLSEYHSQDLTEVGDVQVRMLTLPDWLPMVHKLNRVAGFAAAADDPFFAAAFMGDDHLPKTPGWAGRYLQALRELGSGIVYGDDLVQGERLPTQWAMTCDIVRALGRMVPAPVEHLYCDNAILDLGRAADCIRYLPDVVVEHCHPVAGRGAWDAGYERVNSRTQYEGDHRRYQQWRTDGLAEDAAAVRTLRADATMTKVSS